MSELDPDHHVALIVVDVQQGFDHPAWGRRNNLDADSNIAALVDVFDRTGRPIVVVQHHSANPDSSLHPDHPGHALKDYVAAVSPDLVVTKTVNSSFHGSPDLHVWLQSAGVTDVVICGITTNHCCETTARVAGNLGYEMFFALDATHTFDRTAPDGSVVSADELARVTGANLHGEFGSVVTTEDVVGSLHSRRESSTI